MREIGFNRGRQRRTARHLPALLALCLGTAAPAQEVVTTTTRYTYNVDGALTALSRQTDGGPEEISYFTWDNFVPDADDPSTGSVSAGNGRLLGYGSAPGADAPAFAFDRRDRLVGYSDSAHEIAYDHHATGTMAAATASGAGGWRFYYDDADNAQVTNIYEPDTQRWSSRFRAARFVSDGPEQILLTPRKDLACEYDPSSELVTARTYDAWGAQGEAALAEAYDIADNPFQYAGEFRDPLWGGIYLRARWYDPEVPTFLSRDSASGQLNHYGYGGGNPAMNTDPSGRSWLGKGLKKMDKGVGGHFARILLSPFLGPLELMAHPRGFWRQVRDNRGGIDYFLAAGVALELAGPVSDFVAPVWVNSFSLQTRFTVRLVTDAVLGFGQSATQSHMLQGMKHFDWHAFVRGGEYTIGGIAWTRGVAGIGYRPFGIKANNLSDFLNRNVPEDGEALIFRERVDENGSSEMRGINSSRRGSDADVEQEASVSESHWTTPWQEARNLGLYHERLVAITRNNAYTTEFDGAFVTAGMSADEFITMVRDSGSKFELVGRKANFNQLEFVRANPRGFATEAQFQEYQESLQENPSAEPTFRKYNRYTNNCQHHAAAVRKMLGIR